MRLVIAKADRFFFYCESCYVKRHLCQKQLVDYIVTRIVIWPISPGKLSLRRPTYPLTLVSLGWVPQTRETRNVFLWDAVAQAVGPQERGFLGAADGNADGTGGTDVIIPNIIEVVFINGVDPSDCAVHDIQLTRAYPRVDGPDDQLDFYPIDRQNRRSRKSTLTQQRDPPLSLYRTCRQLS